MHFHKGSTHRHTYIQYIQEHIPKGITQVKIGKFGELVSAIHNWRAIRMHL